MRRKSSTWDWSMNCAVHHNYLGNSELSTIRTTSQKKRKKMSPTKSCGVLEFATSFIAALIRSSSLIHLQMIIHYSLALSTVHVSNVSECLHCIALRICNWKYRLFEEHYICTSLTQSSHLSQSHHNNTTLTFRYMFLMSSNFLYAQQCC